MDAKDGRTIDFDRRKLKKLRKAYDTASSDVFVFEGTELYKSYAKHLIKFLDKSLPK